MQAAVDAVFFVSERVAEVQFILAFRGAAVLFLRREQTYGKYIFFSMVKRYPTRFGYALPLAALLAAASCIYEGSGPCPEPTGVRLAVRVDWSRSGINTANERVTEQVDRVSLRFFPLDGSPAFDRYLDTDVTEGTVDVPLGRYGVVVFNESIYDEAWWEGHIDFTDTENYARFAAHAVAIDQRQRQLRRLGEGEQVAAEPLPLASWSVDELVVTGRMTARAAEQGELTRIVMRPLTHRVELTVGVENLASARSINGAQRGFASTVYMASGATADPSTALFTLNGRRYDPDGVNGTVHASFLTFGARRRPSPTSWRSTRC
jgi:hypothetical protein